MMRWLLIGLLAMYGVSGYADEVESTEAEAADPVEIVTPQEEVIAETAEDAAEAPAAKNPVFVVMVPERIDHEWFWIVHSDRIQHIVQSAIEGALIRAGIEVVDLTTATLPTFNSDWTRLQSAAFAAAAGKRLNADYVISGNATAVRASEGRAYGVNVVRTQAEVSARIIRVSDGRILTVENATVLEGGQSTQAAGQNALRRAGSQIGAKLARAARALAESDTPAP